VSHLSAISMKSDLCCEVRAASANRMHSAALRRNWSKLGKSGFICIDMGTERAHRQRFCRGSPTLSHGPSAAPCRTDRLVCFGIHLNDIDREIANQHLFEIISKAALFGSPATDALKLLTWLQQI
jgi:hypothetical protein